MKKHKLKITPVLITLNVVLLILISSYYIIRGVHYYLDENGKKVDSGEVLLGDYLKNKQSYLDETKGLVYDEIKNVYTYKGAVEDNYLYYSGILFRIMGIDNENNIKAISENNLTIMYSGLEKGFDDSYIANWLNVNEEETSGIFMRNMYNHEEFLSNVYSCEDIVDDLENIDCIENTNNYKGSLLSLYDYYMAGGKKSYLNNGEIFYLSSINSENQNYIILDDGGISINNYATRALGVRPVVAINSGTILLGGKGSKENPYIIENHEKTTLNDVYLGEIIEFNNIKFKIVNKLEDKILVASINAISNEEELITKTFGSDNKYSTNKNTLGHYLNSTYYDSLENKEYIVKSDWYIGTNNLNYTNKYKSKISANVGLLSIGDMFIHEVKNVFTLSRGLDNNGIINIIDNNANLYGDLVTSKYNIRPAFYLNAKLAITGGDGSVDKPYILGDTNEEQSEEE